MRLVVFQPSRNCASRESNSEFDPSEPNTLAVGRLAGLPLKGYIHRARFAGVAWRLKGCCGKTGANWLATSSVRESKLRLWPAALKTILKLLTPNPVKSHCQREATLLPWALVRFSSFRNNGARASSPLAFE